MHHTISRMCTFAPEFQCGYNKLTLNPHYLQIYAVSVDLLPFFSRIFLIMNSNLSESPACEPITLPVCAKALGYTHTSFYNGWGDRNHAQANTSYWNFGEPVVSTGCADDVLFYVCSVLFPYCGEGGEHGDIRRPCMEYCQGKLLYICVCGGGRLYTVQGNELFVEISLRNEKSRS